MPDAVQKHMDNLSTAEVYIPVEKRAWAALQMQAKFYAETSALLFDTSMTDLSILACICTKHEEDKKALNKIRGLN